MAQGEEFADNLKCPHCKIEYDPSDLYDMGMVTLHGTQDGPTFVTCEECEKEFAVKEVVSRHYTTKTLRDLAEHQW